MAKRYQKPRKKYNKEFASNSRRSHPKNYLASYNLLNRRGGRRIVG